MCPFCMAVFPAAERGLLSHMLAGHPVELAILTGVLALAHARLARRPTDMLAVDAAVLLLGAALSRAR